MTDPTHSYRQQLRAAERQLPAATEQALRERRQQALTLTEYRRWPRWLVPASGFAAASVLALVVILTPSSPDTGAQGPAMVGEETRLDEDLDFYYWLAETNSALEG